MILIRLFIYSAGTLLVMTSAAKLVSAGGSARILQYMDPIFNISFQHVFVVVGALEFLVALLCFFYQRAEVKAGLLAWLSTSFLLYRLGLVWVGYHRPCSCMGNLTDALHIPPHAADLTMKIILGYLLLGSYATLFWLWRQKPAAPPTPASSAPIGSPT